MEFGKQLKSIREGKNLSQEHIGNELGIGQPGVSKIENNSRELTVNELYLYADAFEVSASHLLSLLDPRQKDTGGSSNAKIKIELDLTMEDLSKLNLKERINQILK